MTSRFGVLLALVAVGIGPVAFRPVTVAWAAQATAHDHDHDATAPAAQAAPQTPATPDMAQMWKMRSDMMARMTAADTQLKTLVAEMNGATTTDAKLAAMTKLLNAMVEQRAMMRGQMEMQGKMMEQMMPMMMQMMHRPAP